MRRRLRERITERENPASVGLDIRPTREILRIINREDQRVVPAVRKTIPQIERAVEIAVQAIRRGGRLVYTGAGTSGRLGVLDAAECAPTYGTDRVVALIAGGNRALFTPVEGAEDDPEQAVRDLQSIQFSRLDVLVGIAASGRTPYVLAGLRYARRLRAKTIALTVNPEAPMRRWSNVSIIPVVGPEVIAGSSRMKAGTAQKLVLNMLSTATMVRLGRVLSNRMLCVQLTNQKLRKRAHAILTRVAGVSPTRAARALEKSGRNLPVALLMLLKNVPKQKAIERLQEGAGAAEVIRAVLAEQGREPGP